MQIEEVLEKYRIPHARAGTHRHVRTGWVGVDCPWCGEVGKYHLGINLQSFACSCWKCGKHSLASALATLIRCTPTESYRLVSSIKRQTFDEEGKEELPVSTLEMPDGLEPLGKAHQRYLKKRGFDPDELVRLWDLKGIGVRHTSLKWRIFIPVYVRGKIVTWTTRSIGAENKQRYLNASPQQEAVPIKKCLYGADYVVSSAVLVEGPTDVWNVGYGAVCGFGLALGPNQLKQLTKIPIRYICFDAAASKQAEAVADVLSVFPGKTATIELDADDPGSASKKEIKKLRKAVFGQ